MPKITINWEGHFVVLHPTTGQEHSRHADYKMALEAAALLSNELRSSVMVDGSAIRATVLSEADEEPVVPEPIVEPVDEEEPHPSPEDPIEPEPVEPQPIPTPTPAAQTLSLVGLSEFHSDILPDDERIWFIRATNQLPASHGGKNIVDFMRTQGTDGNKEPTYTFARYGGIEIDSMLVGLRTTGYLGFLDAVADIVNVIGSRLKGPVSQGGYTFRYFPEYDSLATLDEMLLHGYLAHAALAFHLNRHHVSPAASASGKVHHYGPLADYWFKYLTEDFPSKWWSGGKGSDWNFSMNGGTYTGNSNRAATSDKLPFIWRHFRHVTWGFLLYYYAIWKRTGSKLHEDQFRQSLAKMLTEVRHVGQTSSVWTFGEGNSTYLMPSTYVHYCIDAIFHLWTEGEISTESATRMTGAIWEFMPVNGYQSFKGNSNATFGISVGGGALGKTTTVGGLSTAKPGDRYNNREGDYERQNQYESSMNGLSAIFHNEALEMNKWIYQNIRKESNTPSVTKLPMCILAALRYRKLKAR